MRHWRLGLAGALALLAGCTPAGQLTDVGDLPVAFVRGEPVVDVSIRGKPVRLILDTGAETSVLTPKAVARLQVHRDFGSFRVDGAGGGVYATASYPGNLTMDRAVDVGVVFAVVALGHDGETADGVVGDDVLNGYDIALDFPHHRIALFDPAGDADVIPFAQGQFVRLPMTTLASRRHEISLSLDGSAVSALVDTGWAAPSSVQQAALDRLGLHPLSCGGVITMYGVGGLPAQGRLCRFETITIGGEVLPHPLLIVQTGPATDYDMVLGEDYLRRHEVFISNRYHAMYLGGADTER